MKIAVIGAGYVGLVAGACFASFNMEVTCIDNDESKIEKLRRNIIPIYEPGLEEIVTRASQRGNLKFSSQLSDINYADIIIIAVGTPSLPTGKADLSYLMRAIDDITKISTGEKTLIIKSTVPIGTANMIRAKLENMKINNRFHLISNPEFLREGSAVYDFLKPDRIIVGTNSNSARKVAQNLYQPLTTQDVPLFITDNTTAETIKYSANAYLAMRVAYINEMADLCEKVGASIDHVAQGMGMDHRIGRHYLHAGPGYGGSCFPKDTQALSHIAQNNNISLSIVDAVIAANDTRKLNLARRIVNSFKQHDCHKIAILGLTFKADTDDMRDSAALVIIPELLKSGFKLNCYDPAKPKTAETLLDINLHISLESCLKDADAALIITEWPEFKLIEPEKLAKLLHKKILYDLRNIYNPSDIEGTDLIYYSIGRPHA
jgi:UDPglucose 6-dehydrogenase